MINFIAGAVVTVLSILIGYSLGKGSSIIPEETRKQVKKLIDAMPFTKHDLGAVERPSAQDIKRFDNPLLKEEEEAMSETFREIVPK